jgi:hypothetical protein
MTGIMELYPAQYTLIPFGAYPMVRIPFSYDLDGIQHIAEATTLWSYQLGDAFMGSSPGSALGLWYLSLRWVDTREKTIIILSDGSANTGYTWDTFLPLLQEAHIPVIACAIGAPDYVLGESYNNTPIMSARDTGFLENIATETHGTLAICNDRTSSLAYLNTTLHENKTAAWDATQVSSRENRPQTPAVRILFFMSLAYHLIINAYSYIVYTRKK